MSYEVVIVGDSGGKMLWDSFATVLEAEIDAAKVITYQFARFRTVVLSCAKRSIEAEEQEAA